MFYKEITHEEIEIDTHDGKVRMNSFNLLIKRKTVYYLFGIPYRTVYYQRVGHDFWKDE